MTYQAPDGWQFPVHGTHHAAPFGHSTPVRLHTRRALRLVALTSDRQDSAQLLNCFLSSPSRLAKVPEMRERR